MRAVYNRGNKIPEIWPAWVKAAVIGWCDYEVLGDEFIWHDGIWERGSWYGSVWHAGRWIDGRWQSGIWSDGTWYNGTWCGGEWHGGAWYRGDWLDGTWFSGDWYGGDWENGTFHSGLWLDGVWEMGVFGGIWSGGTWYSGEFKGFEQTIRWKFQRGADERTIGGWHRGEFQSLLPEEWDREDLPPEQRAALKAHMAYWAELEALENPKPTEGTSLWDIL